MLRLLEHGADPGHQLARPASGAAVRPARGPASASRSPAPPAGRASPASACASVDLPAPLGPTSAVARPARGRGRRPGRPARRPVRRGGQPAAPGAARRRRRRASRGARGTPPAPAAPREEPLGHPDPCAARVAPCRPSTVVGRAVGDRHHRRARARRPGPRRPASARPGARRAGRSRRCRPSTRRTVSRSSRAPSRVEHRGRLVEQQQARTHGQHAGEREPLPLAAGQVRPSGAPAVAEADRPQRLVDPRPDLLAGHREVLQAEGDVVPAAGEHGLRVRVLQQQACSRGTAAAEHARPGTPSRVSASGRLAAVVVLVHAGRPGRDRRRRAARRTPASSVDLPAPLAPEQQHASRRVRRPGRGRAPPRRAGRRAASPSRAPAGRRAGTVQVDTGLRRESRCARTPAATSAPVRGQRAGQRPRPGTGDDRTRDGQAERRSVSFQPAVCVGYDSARSTVEMIRPATAPASIAVGSPNRR